MAYSINSLYSHSYIITCNGEKVVFFGHLFLKENFEEVVTQLSYNLLGHGLSISRQPLLCRRKLCFLSRLDMVLTIFLWSNTDVSFEKHAKITVTFVAYSITNFFYTHIRLVKKFFSLMYF